MVMRPVIRKPGDPVIEDGPNDFKLPWHPAWNYAAVALSIGLTGAWFLLAPYFAGDRSVPGTPAASAQCAYGDSKKGSILKVDYAAGTVNGYPAEFTAKQITWHDTEDGGYYALDRTSGELVMRHASSVGGYLTWQTCRFGA
jgi:hypothetical protein